MRRNGLKKGISEEVRGMRCKDGELEELIERM